MRAGLWGTSLSHAEEALRVLRARDTVVECNGIHRPNIGEEHLHRLRTNNGVQDEAVSHE